MCGGVGKLFPRIAPRILAQVVSSSSCERNWSSYSFVHSKARNRLHSVHAADLVYVYTNSRVLDQPMSFTDEATREWYTQSVVSEDSDSDGPTNIVHDYNDVSDSDRATLDGVSSDDENPQREFEGIVQVGGFRLGEDGRDLED
jgi:hypothetical protein